MKDYDADVGDIKMSLSLHFAPATWLHIQASSLGTYIVTDVIESHTV